MVGTCFDLVAVLSSMGVCVPSTSSTSRSNSGRSTGDRVSGADGEADTLGVGAFVDRAPAGAVDEGGPDEE